MNRISPYPGLTAFDETHVQLFFGREEFIESLLRTLRNQHLIAIVGPAGSGKTSVLRAGLIPALLQQSPPLRVAYLRPGTTPLKSLTLALTGGTTFELSDPAAVQRRWEASSPDVLIVDQFEELFILSDRSQVESFVDLLVSNAKTARTRVVLGVRSDFMSQMIANANLAQVLSAATFFLGGLTKEQLRRAIEEPARIAGISLEAGLVERLVEDVGSEPGNLPAMQLVLNSMYHTSAADHNLTYLDYARTGGAPGVIARQCELFWEVLTQAERQATRTVLLRLVTAAQTRRVAPRDEFSRAETLTLNRLIDARLLVASGDATDTTIFIEIAHEAMIRSWTRLRDWIEEEKDFLSWRDRLSTFARAWYESNRDHQFLLSGGFLAEAERWLATLPDGFSELETSYVATSREHQNLIDLRVQALKSQQSTQPIVFISYAHDDEGPVLTLCERLRQSGLRSWIDKQQIEVGQEWDRVIRKALMTADFIVVCLSQRSIGKKGYVQREIRLALDLYNEMPLGTRLLMPVRLEQCAVPDELARYQYADLFRPEGFERLVRSMLGEWESRKM
jgi:hypothetical protein